MSSLVTWRPAVLAAPTIRPDLPTTTRHNLYPDFTRPVGVSHPNILLLFLLINMSSISNQKARFTRLVDRTVGEVERVELGKSKSHWRL